MCVVIAAWPPLWGARLWPLAPDPAGPWKSRTHSSSRGIGSLRQLPHTPRYTSCLTEKPAGTARRCGFQEKPPGATGSPHPGLLRGHACLSLWSLCITHGPAYMCKIWGTTGGDVTPMTFLSSQVRGPKPWSPLHMGRAGCTWLLRPWPPWRSAQGPTGRAGVAPGSPPRAHKGCTQCLSPKGHAGQLSQANPGSSLQAGGS